MYDIEKLKDQLRLHEGVRLKPYVDTVGKVTIGVGHNLTDLGLPPAIVDVLLEQDIAQAARDVFAVYPEWTLLSEARQRVLLDMSFNMGRARLAGFVNMLRNLRDGNFAKAADEMKASRWAQQVGARADRLADMMREG